MVMPLNQRKVQQTQDPRIQKVDQSYPLTAEEKNRLSEKGLRATYHTEYLMFEAAQKGKFTTKDF